MGNRRFDGRAEPDDLAANFVSRKNDSRSLGYKRFELNILLNGTSTLIVSAGLRKNRLDQRLR
jgi:hypothetical protein